MKLLLTIPAFLFFQAAISLACQAVTSGQENLAGDWTGESICTVHPSSCHDEHVIYHLTEPDSAGKLQIRADRIVDGRPVDMGTLDCMYDRQHSSISCRIDQGVWEFAVAGSTMTGTFKHPDGTVFRKVSVQKKQ